MLCCCAFFSFAHRFHVFSVTMPASMRCILPGGKSLKHEKICIEIRHIYYKSIFDQLLILCQTYHHVPDMLSLGCFFAYGMFFRPARNSRSISRCGSIGWDLLCLSTR